MKQIALALCALAFCAGATSAGAAEWSAWRTQHAQSFPATPEAAAEQFRQHGASAEEVALLQRELELHSQGRSARCYDTVSPPNSRYEKLSMNRPGKPPVAFREEQQLGRTVPVVECRIGDKILHWFNEPVRGCNNLGELYVEVRQPRGQLMCRDVPLFGHQPEGDTFQFLPGFVYQKSCGCYVYLPGSVLTTQGDNHQSGGVSTECFVAPIN